MILLLQKLKTLEGDNVGMGLFEKFKKKNETHKESYSKEQKELKFIIQQNQAIFGNAFLGKRATDAEITQAEQKLALKIPDPFIWFLKEYGCGGYWFDIMGYCKNGKPEFVEITLEQRKNGLPEKYIIIEDCDEFYYCIDSVSGKISSWSQYDKDGIRERFDNFYEFFKDNLQNAMDNFQKTGRSNSAQGSRKISNIIGYFG